MTKIYRVLVYLVTFAIPVVIAACYGPAYRYRRGGRVLDKVSRAPISQIDVSCERDGGSTYPDRTGDDGVFQLQFDDCETVKAVDSLPGAGDGGAVDAGSADAGSVDAGATDGGNAADGGLRTVRYAPKSVPFDPNGGDITIEMDRSN